MQTRGRTQERELRRSRTNRPGPRVADPAAEKESFRSSEVLYQSPKREPIALKSGLMDHLTAVGRSVLRPDGLAKVTGKALYLDDLPEDGCWHGVTVRSPHPSALIVSIDASGVPDAEAKVLTAKDVGPRN